MIDDSRKNVVPPPFPGLGTGYLIYRIRDRQSYPPLTLFQKEIKNASN
jgi:hypothetical protein